MDTLFERGDFHNNIANEINENIRYFNRNSYRTSTKIYNRLLEKKDISVEKKKNELLKQLHNLIIKTFAINFGKVRNKWLLAEIKKNIRILRALVLKLRNINYHLETTFLDEIGLLKKPFFINVRKKRVDELVKEDFRAISKKDINKLEDTAYKLIGKIINLDKRLIGGYKSKETKIIKKEKYNIRDLEDILKKQSELLCHLEAKLPPPCHINQNLFQQKNFTKWVSRLLALLALLEHTYKTEIEIFKKLKINKNIEKKINMYISHLMDEKWKMLKIKQKKIMIWDKAEEIDKEWKRISHHWSTIANL